MRLNRFIALSTGLSRRAADAAIAEQRVRINDHIGELGETVSADDKVILDGQPVELRQVTTIILNKPVGYVCSREGQGSKTIYNLLPKELHQLKPIGRLDKDSSGLLLLTNDGKLAHELTHPSFQKEKIYEVELNKPLGEADRIKLSQGVILVDGLSRLRVTGDRLRYRVIMTEGRNRQIRRTFAAMGYSVTALHRIAFGSYHLPTGLRLGTYSESKAA